MTYRALSPLPRLFRHLLPALLAAGLLLLCTCGPARAQTAPPQPAPLRPLEPGPPRLPQPPAPTPPRLHRQPAPAAQPPVELSDADLARDLGLTERILNQAMLREDWGTLQRIMRFYPWMPGADPILRDYVQGALLRHQGRLAAAIALYRTLVAQHPGLDYVRLELATMLMEDRRLREAGAELARLRQRPLEPAAQRGAQLYRQALAQQRRWQLRLGAGPAYSNNVNSANRDRQLLLPVAVGEGTLWLPFDKDPGALPRADWGLRYSGGASLERNLAGHHHYTLDASLEGMAHHAEHDYDEGTLTLRGGYKWQDARRWFAATPQLGQAWLGGRRYSHNHGLALEYGWRATPAWQFMGTALWQRRRYDNRDYAAYDGWLGLLSLTAVRNFSPRLLVFGSLGLQRESVAAAEYSHRFPWAQLGLVRTFGDKLGVRLSARYGRLSYRRPYALFLHQRRRDHELRLDAELWTPGFTLAGLQPRLNIGYLKVTSNLAMYARDRTELSLLLEKRF